MKIQIFPNWCKKLGLIIFFLFSFVSGGDDFIDGLIGHPYKSEIGSTLFLSYFGENLIHFFDVLGIIGILIYMMSKEKIEDDYITKLRLESFQLTAIIGLSLTILLYAFSKDIKLTLDYFIMLFLMFYLVIFFIKKRIDL
ncbi:hypothetical protein [Lutibacter sp.]